MALSVLPLGSLWQWFVRIWPAAEFEAEFSGTEALATGGLLLLRQILRLVAKAAGVIAVVAVQSDSAVTAGAGDKDSTMLGQIGRNPLNAEALKVAVTTHDFEARSGKPQISQVGIFQTDVGLIDLAVIARNGVAQVMNAD